VAEVIEFREGGEERSTIPNGVSLAFM